MDNYIGVLLGGCCGDVLGSQTEGMTKTQISKQYGFFGVKELPLHKKFTDDTQMTLVLSRHLVNNNRCIKDIKTIHQEYANNINNKGYSSSTRKILENIKNNSENTSKIGESYANGSIMRISPLGLVNSTSNEELLQKIKMAIYCTHGGNDQSISSAFLHTKLIQAFVNKRFKNIFESFDYVMQLASCNPDLFCKINIVRYCLNRKSDSDITWELTGNSNTFQIRAVDCLAISLYIFFKHYDLPLHAVQVAASIGGDTDTIAKIVGDLCGALHGTTWIPESWKGVEGENELKELGAELYRMGAVSQ